ncbi:MAG: hypothetical protein FWC70_03630 [Defluviitaleaceae bacterium]|nr:hypothetical protein [Defluviitaleaceae bacterium]
MNMATWKEESTDEARLQFEPRKWQSENNLAERTVITDPAGGLTEVFCLGNWHKQRAEINSQAMPLKKNTDYTFAFWLNGGENDRRAETCQLRVCFNGDDKNPLIFRLNRGYIKPAKYSGGWYRYEIPFNTGDADGESVETTLQFTATDAHCAVMPDKPVFDALPDDDRPDPRIPQRHNIVFTDGWPHDASWSHLVFGGGENIRALSESLGIDIDAAIITLPGEEKAELIRQIIEMTLPGN